MRRLVQAACVACGHDSIPLNISENERRRDRVVPSHFLERMRGIEPPLSAWEAGVLPMNYIRM